ncbi:hypothetical protein F4811DRAFT_124167 [Daldinia bambusicola]|nr:hypothetical protein F4811DRAFT_124167 [Daldinia bambusicola]
MSSSGARLSTGRIIAIIVSAVVAVTFLIALPVAIRCCVIRRQQSQSDIEKIPKRELETPPSESTASHKERDDTDKPRTSAADTVQNSVWGDASRSVIPASIFDGDGDIWDSRKWPLPPGHSERYTFFSERSSISVDDEMDIEQLGGRDHNGNYKTGKMLERGSMCESIWGISEARIVH